jgi:hypothetical protein
MRLVTSNRAALVAGNLVSLRVGLVDLLVRLVAHLVVLVLGA